jgi:hypothetical protein
MYLVSISLVIVLIPLHPIGKEWNGTKYACEKQVINPILQKEIYQISEITVKGST